MAERSFPPGSVAPNIAPLYEEGSIAEESNVIYGNFQPEVNRREAKRHIGKITMSITLAYTEENGTVHEITPEYGEILSSEPMRIDEDTKGNIDILFKQYWRGYRGDSYGTPQLGYVRPADNGSRLETIRLLNLHWNARTQSVEPYYINPRDFRYKFADYESRMRRKGGKEELEALRKDLWENQD